MSKRLLSTSSVLHRLITDIAYNVHGSMPRWDLIDEGIQDSDRFTKRKYRHFDNIWGQVWQLPALAFSTPNVLTLSSHAWHWIITIA